MLKLSDLRKTTRGTSTAGLRTVHPHFLRDRSLLPRIELSVRYLDSMVGHARKELDPEVMVQLFGDHKLARGIAAALAGSYAFRQLTFDDVLESAACERLNNHGLTTPSDARLWLFRRANVKSDGFVKLAARTGFFKDAGAEFDLEPLILERLMTLDASANAVLVRVGQVPQADDVIARYNFQVASALVANSSLVRIALRKSCDTPAAMRELCRLADVRYELSARELVLHGRQDVFGGWARYGARLARLLAELLIVGLPARGLESMVEAGDNSQWLFKADEEILTYLGMPRTPEAGRWSAEMLPRMQRQVDTLMSAFASLRRAQMHHGWTLRRATEPHVTARGVVPLVATASRGRDRLELVVKPDHDAGALVRILGHHAYLALDVAESTGHSAALTFAHEAGIATSGAVELVPQMLDTALAASNRDSESERWSALFDEVERTGVLTEARMAARLECSEDAVASAINQPSTRHERVSRGIRYVEGFGLCTHAVMSRARNAAREVAALRGGEQVGPAWTARVLGRRLREVTGASEGIECLIAYLGAA